MIRDLVAVLLFAVLVAGLSPNEQASDVVDRMLARVDTLEQQIPRLQQALSSIERATESEAAELKSHDKSHAAGSRQKRLLFGNFGNTMIGGSNFVTNTRGGSAAAMGVGAAADGKLLAGSAASATAGHFSVTVGGISGSVQAGPSQGFQFGSG